MSADVYLALTALSGLLILIWAIAILVYLSDIRRGINEIVVHFATEDALADREADAREEGGSKHGG